MSLISGVAVVGTSLIFILVTVVVLVFNKGTHIPKDRVEIFNFMRQYTPGNFAKGYQRRNFIGPKRTLIEYFPTDVNPHKNQKVEIQRIVVENRKIIDLPKGSFSNNESQRWLLPPTCHDFPNQLKETHFGKLLMAMTEQINLDIEENELVRSSMSTQSLLLNETKGLKLVREFIKTSSNLNKDILKKASISERNSSSSNLFPSNKPIVRP